jgi:hypothetical protein
MNPKVELASGEYDRRKLTGILPGTDQVAKLFGVRPETLRNYRANHISRKPRIKSLMIIPPGWERNGAE